MAEHPIIWLQPRCDGCDGYENSFWCEDDMGPCEECGAPCVKYVLAPDQPQPPPKEDDEDGLD